MECKKIEPLTVEWIKKKKDLKTAQCCATTSLTLMGSISEKIGSLGTALSQFHSLVILDVSRNAIGSLDGLQYCKELKELNLYYNNISEQSELLKLCENTRLEKIELRLNPISKFSSEYRIQLVHALVHLRELDSVHVTDRDRKVSLEHYNTDQAAKFAAMENQENIPEPVIADKLDKLAASEALSAQFYSTLRPPQNILTPTRQAYNAMTARGQYTPSPSKAANKPSLSSTSEGSEAPSMPSTDSHKKTRRKESYYKGENVALREKVATLTTDYNQAIASRISKESYVRLQEQHHAILKETEELRALYATSSQQVEALKDHISSTELQNQRLREELKVKDELYVVDTQLKEQCSELQDTISKERGQHREELQKQAHHTTAIHEEYVNKIKDLKLQHVREMEEVQTALTKAHMQEIQQMHWNFETLKETVSIAGMMGYCK